MENVSFPDCLEICCTIILRPFWQPQSPALSPRGSSMPLLTLGVPSGSSYTPWAIYVLLAHKSVDGAEQKQHSLRHHSVLSKADLVWSQTHTGVPLKVLSSAHDCTLHNFPCPPEFSWTTYIWPIPYSNFHSFSELIPGGPAPHSISKRTLLLSKVDSLRFGRNNKNRARNRVTDGRGQDIQGATCRGSSVSDLVSWNQRWPSVGEFAGWTFRSTARESRPVRIWSRTF